MPTKNKFFQIFFAYYFLKVRSSVFIDIKSKRSYNIVEIKVFLLFFSCLWKDPDADPYKIMTDMDPGGPKTYGSGSTTLVATGCKCPCQSTL